MIFCIFLYSNKTHNILLSMSIGYLLLFASKIWLVKVFYLKKKTFCRALAQLILTFWPPVNLWVILFSRSRINCNLSESEEWGGAVCCYSSHWFVTHIINADADLQIDIVNYDIVLYFVPANELDQRII